MVRVCCSVLQCVAVRCSVRDIQTRMVRVSIFGPELWHRWKRPRGGGSEVVCVWERETERERTVGGKKNKSSTPCDMMIRVVRVRCSLLQCVAVCCSALQEQILDTTWNTDSNGRVCCSVLQCVVVCVIYRLEWCGCPFLALNYGVDERGRGGGGARLFVCVRERDRERGKGGWKEE